MCGITGVISKRSIKASSIKKMNDAIIHRGPDDEGFFLAGEIIKDVHLKKTVITTSKNFNVAFGHKRLSIIDLSEQGHQPMCYMDRYWITYNGEIFNYIELKKDLEKLGYSFKSKTDTEVILAAYDAWGVDCQKKFNGMWAFALFDIEKDVIFISRDRFGEKPLYFYQDNQNFIFASEVKALLENEAVNTDPNIIFLRKFYDTGAKEYMRETVFTNIYKFNFSSYIILNSKNFIEKISEIPYWDYQVDTSLQEYNHNEAVKYAKKYYLLLKDAVRIRLRADVNIAATLSGGLDSSSIVYLINEIKKEEKKDYTIETFSNVFHTKETIECDESYYINLITKQLGIKSNQITTTANEVTKLQTYNLKFTESPQDGVSVHSIKLLELIHNSGFKVVLEGQGADEQQAGYLPYVINYLYHLPLFKLFSEYQKIKNIQGSHIFLKRGFFFSLICKVVGAKFAVKMIRMLIGKDMYQYTMHLNHKLKDDTNKSLISLIHYADRRSMMYSIEARLPFMDYRLIEFMAKIPSVYKIHDGWTKYFARLAFDGKLPDEITWRRDKMGWPAPEKYWLEGELKNWLISSINKSKFIQKEIKKVRLDNNLSKHNLTKLIRLLNISAWHNVFFKNNKKNLLVKNY
jgi:asparagine synthase (glutamine-hydrolysing)